MEPFYSYVLKSSGLLLVFYLVYYFLLRKETFFTNNRWFLLSGLVTSLLLPLCTITKILYIERPKLTYTELVDFQTTTSIIEQPIVVESFNWSPVFYTIYFLIATIFTIKIVLSIVSFFKLKSKGQLLDNNEYKIVYLNEECTPFSFFNYIVLNPSIYSIQELDSIILHEKVHCQEKHSIDVLVVQLLCAVFWFNPIIWFYRKALLQNLEYIADQKATAQIEDKKAYQLTLLKVVSNQNCLLVTNNFYQPYLSAGRSLIKKRIVMLNKKQSNKRNAWKYSLVVPFLIGFIFLFQIETKAQVKEETETVPVRSTNTTEKTVNPNDTENVLNLVIDKISSDKELADDVKVLNEKFDVDLKINYVKRNKKGEIIAIKLTYDDKNGNIITTKQKRTIPIRPIFVKSKRLETGEMQIGFYDNYEMKVLPKDSEKERKISLIENLPDDAIIYVDNELYDKESLEYLDVNGLKSIKILTDAASLEKYDAKGKKQVVVIETNWETKKKTNSSSTKTIMIKNNGTKAENKSPFNTFNTNSNTIPPDIYDNKVVTTEITRVDKKVGENVIILLRGKIIEGDLSMFSQSELEQYNTELQKTVGLDAGLFVYKDKKLKKLDLDMYEIDKLYSSKYNVNSLNSSSTTKSTTKTEKDNTVKKLKQDIADYKVTTSFSESNDYDYISELKKNKDVDYKKALLIFDGKVIKYKELDKINPATIGTVAVMTATKYALDKYGNKAKNGVIEIKSKKYFEETDPIYQKMLEKSKLNND